MRKASSMNAKHDSDDEAKLLGSGAGSDILSYHWEYRFTWDLHHFHLALFSRSGLNVERLIPLSCRYRR